jgi:uncharacterized membrane protein YgaE (UPF0421/DUF939 family)
VSQDSKCISIIQRLSLIVAIQTAIALPLSFYAGKYFNLLFPYGFNTISGLWSATAAILVTQALLSEALNTAWYRVAGTFIGALVAFILDSIWGYNLWTLAGSILVTVMLISAFRLKYTFRMACLTTTVITAFGMAAAPQFPVWYNCSSRFVEALIGAVVATLVVWIFTPLRNKLAM